MISAFEQYFTALKGKRVAVLGLGVSNRPLVRLLLRYGCTVTGCVVGEYEVEIVKVYGNKQQSGRNMLVKHSRNPTGSASRPPAGTVPTSTNTLHSIRKWCWVLRLWKAACTVAAT